MKLKIENVTKTFKNEVVLSNVNYEFTSGRIYAIIGRNGSGKSVLMKMIAGLYLQDDGNILFDNINYNLKKEFPKNIGIVIEHPTFISDLTGFENLKLLSQIQNKITDKEILEALEIVNLSSEKDKKFSKFSLGMKQKLSIAQAIMEKPDVLLLDEPFNGIDRGSVTKIKEYLVKLKKENKLILIATHIREDIEDIKDITLYLEEGKLNIENDMYNKDIS